jgi:hypothetical protein
MIWRNRFVHYVPVRIREGCSTWVESSIRARDEASGVGQRMIEVDVWSVSLVLEKLIVGQHSSICDVFLLLVLPYGGHHND